MSIIFGSNSIQKVYFGSEEADKVYFGSNLVYQAVEPTPEFVRFDVPGDHTFVWPWDTSAGTAIMVAGDGGRGGGDSIDPNLTPTSQHLRFNPTFGGSLAYGGEGRIGTGLRGGLGFDSLGSGGGGGGGVQVWVGQGQRYGAIGGDGGAGQELPAGASYGYAGEVGGTRSLDLGATYAHLALGAQFNVRIGAGGVGGGRHTSALPVTTETVGSTGETGYIIFRPA